jgi:hypothetical protein
MATGQAYLDGAVDAMFNRTRRLPTIDELRTYATVTTPGRAREAKKGRGE